MTPPPEADSQKEQRSPRWTPVRFLDDPIEAIFDRPPALLKTPGPPSAFVWRGRPLVVREVAAQWADHERRGRMRRNMSEDHLETASRKGSWGVGRFYFRVVVEDGRAFDIYYDRAPEEAGDRAGHWFVWREVAAK